MRQVSAGGAVFNVIDRGAGPAVLLIHGFPLDQSMWQAQLDALAMNNRLIAPDLRGFGRSTVTEGTVTMEQMADDLAALLDALGLKQPVCLCGLSMGGYIALAFWRKYRERVRSLVLCDTRSAADTPEAAAARGTLAERATAEGMEQVAEAMLPKLIHPETPKVRPRVAAAVKQMILGTNPRGAAAALRGMAIRPDSANLLPTINVRTLVIAGEKDAISPPEEMRKIAAAIPGARFVVIPEAGHMSPMENPERFNEELQSFLADEPLMR